MSKGGPTSKVALTSFLRGCCQGPDAPDSLLTRSMHVAPMPQAKRLSEAVGAHALRKDALPQRACANVP
eukprot:1195264-Prorocentrum_minimum.AAC.5